MCTQILSDMGAEVLKIENPDGGDDTRKGAGPRAGGEQGESHFFMAFNRGKRSVALDFTKPEGQAVVHKLLATADVMVQNFRPGVLKKYGLDHDSLLLRRQLHHAPIPVGIAERCKDALADAEVGGAVMRAFDHLGQAQRCAAEAICGHGHQV